MREYSNSGMKVFSSGVMRPKQCRTTVRKYLGKTLMLKKFMTTTFRSGGRGAAISGSRPTMMVSLWWRVWLQRQTMLSRITMNEAISYSALFIQSVLKAVPWPASCQRASEVEAYSTP